MSTLSPSSSPLLKRIACIAATTFTAAVVLFLPEAQHALTHGIRPAHAAALGLKASSLHLPGTRNFWHTEGNRILDSHNRPVRISGMNWSGLETREAVPGGLEAQDYRAILRTVKQNGYNTLRLPYSNEMVESPTVPDHIGFSSSSGPINTDLRDRNSLEILDRIVAYAGKIGLKVILDNHRSEAGSSAEESGLWYTAQYPESAWIADWTFLARRYQNNPAVIGMDLRNEPHNADKGGACWDCGGANDWHRAATRAGNAILAVNPHLLIFVEGTDSYAGDTYWWGGNLEGVRRSPVHLALPNQLVYSAHEYGPTEYAQAWFNPSTSPATLAAVWRRHWAYVSESGIAPVWIGEFGTPNTDVDVQSSLPGSEGQWFSSLVSFLTTHPQVNWTYWGINGEDRYGLLDTNYSSQPASGLKAEALASIGSEPSTSQPTVAVAQPSREVYAPIPTSFAPPAVRSEQSPEPGIASKAVLITPPQLAESGLPRKHAARRQSSAESVQSAIAASVHSAVSTATLNLSDGSGASAR